MLIFSTPGALALQSQGGAQKAKDGDKVGAALVSSTHYTFCAPSCLFALVSCTLEMVLELLFKFDFWALPFAPLLPITSQSWSTLSKNPIICMFLAILALFICYLKEEARGQSWPQRSDGHSVKMISNQFQGPSPVPRGPSTAKDSEKMFQIEARGQKQWNWRNNERRLEQSSVVRFWRELHICGWFGCYLKDIHTDQPKEAPGIDVILFWQSGHMTSEVNFGLWPLLAGLIEDFSKSTLTIHEFSISNQF